MKLISEKYVKTRKAHKCSMCLREFPKGALLNRQVIAHDDYIYSNYCCETCQNISHYIELYNNEIPEGTTLMEMEGAEFMGTPEEFLEEIG